MLPARLVPVLTHKRAQAAAAKHLIRCVSQEGLEGRERPQPWGRDPAARGTTGPTS